MAIMALDVGSKRIGVAIADPTRTYAIPLATITRKNKRDDLASIATYLESYGIEELVVGDPIALSGERGIAAREMDAFVDQLRRVFNGPIHQIDERMTSAQANKSLIGADVSRHKRREIVDRLAAGLILETFLARRRHGLA